MVLFNTAASSAIDPGKYVALGLTHVQYDGSDKLAKLLALVTLSPIFLLCAYVTIIIYRRELTFINALFGQLGCEGINWGLKRLIRQPRPYRHLGKGYAMPSSHAQFLGFFCAFFLSHFYLHHPKAAVPRTLVNTMRRLEHLCAMVAIVGLTIATCYSRYHLSYHTPLQVIIGLVIGLVIGFVYYYLTEQLPRQPLRLPGPFASPVASPVSSPISEPTKSTSLRHRTRKTSAEGSSSVQMTPASSQSAVIPSSSPPSTPSRQNRQRRRSSLSTLLIPELHPAPPIRQLILDHPLAVAFRLRDSWLVWLDGGIEGEYDAWRSEWERRRAPYPLDSGRAREGKGQHQRLNSIAETLDGYTLEGLAKRTYTRGSSAATSGQPSRIQNRQLAADTESNLKDGSPVEKKENDSIPLVSNSQTQGSARIPLISNPSTVRMMEQALDEARKCGPTTTAFSVGCVMTLRGSETVVSKGYSREMEGNTHAEQCAMAKLTSSSAKLEERDEKGRSISSKEDSVVELDLYTTMEPCSERLSGATPCAQRILAFNADPPVLRGREIPTVGRARIVRVFQGVTEPEDFIKENTGLNLLREGGIEVLKVVRGADLGGEGLGSIEREALKLARYGHPESA